MCHHRSGGRQMRGKETEHPLELYVESKQASVGSDGPVELQRDASISATKSRREGFDGLIVSAFTLNP